MTVGRLTTLSWVMFSIMSIGFLPLCAGALALDLPAPLPHVLAAGVIVFWWSWFAYGMYLAMAVMRNGDKRLLRRGIRGTAQVLEAAPTNTVIQAGEFEWEAPRVWKYKLRCSVRDKVYDTWCRVCHEGIAVGQQVAIAAAPHNLARVTIDYGQDRKGGRAAPEVHTVAPNVRIAVSADPSEDERISTLERLAELRDKGVLTEEEFEREKRNVLGRY